MFTVILPASALDTLVRLKIQYPMLFRVSNRARGDLFTHCGVLDFTAEEGRCYVPAWMAQQLQVAEGGKLRVESTQLPKGTFCCLQPMSGDFLHISNPTVVLEHALQSYATLTVGDMFPVRLRNVTYTFAVKELRPNSAVSVIETDMNLDFAPPLVTEPEPQLASQTAPAIAVPAEETTAPLAVAEAAAAAADEPVGFVPFTGFAARLSGRPLDAKTPLDTAPAPPPPAAATTCRLFAKKPKFSPFTGEAHTLGDHATGASQNPVRRLQSAPTISAPATTPITAEHRLTNSRGRDALSSSTEFAPFAGEGFRLGTN
eukprot:TRINITY_DN2833_c0_g1_i2.p1 TRINITY_DN2833_c0_g1~~TRINITY_DN2833_c0_g1_i2.p1  ORF type:complete len:316 (-),score=86.00 TRINITY_DN2833_c0_g1_i2:107-1054(-)